MYKRGFLHSRMADYQELLGLLVLTRQWGLLGCVGASCPYAAAAMDLIVSVAPGWSICHHRKLDVGGMSMTFLGERKDGIEVEIYRPLCRVFYVKENQKVGGEGSRPVVRRRAWDASEWKGEKGQESQEKRCCGLTVAGVPCWARTSLGTLRSRCGVLRRAGLCSSCVPRQHTRRRR